MPIHYATYDYAEGEFSHATRCDAIADERSQLTRDPVLVTCVECKR